MWAKLLARMTDPGRSVRLTGTRVVSKAEWDRLLMPEYPDGKPLDRTDPGY